jgi:hypothetical protein
MPLLPYRGRVARLCVAVCACAGLLSGAGLLWSTGAQAQAPAAQAPAPPVPPALPTAPSAADLGVRVELEPQAIELLKAMSHRLATAHTMTFTAVATYESAARTGEPLAYTTISEVAVQRPNMLRVITPGDGPPSEFVYDGRTMVAFSPQANLVAIAEAPPTIDAMLKAAYQEAALYFPFTDVIVADPYGDIAEGLKLAFVVGQSLVVGGTTTDIIVLATDSLQAQVWIGAEDRLPRMIRATFFGDPAHYRHSVAFSNWHLNGLIPRDHFVSAHPAHAMRIPFQSPETSLPKPATPEGAKP